jgi:hypothetical protein
MPAAVIGIMRAIPPITRMRWMSPITAIPRPATGSPAPKAANPNKTWSRRHGDDIHLVWRRRTRHVDFSRGFSDGRRSRGRAAAVNCALADDTPRQQERGADGDQNRLHYFFIHNTHKTRRTVGCIQSVCLCPAQSCASTGLDAFIMRLLRINCNHFIYMHLSR